MPLMTSGVNRFIFYCRPFDVAFVGTARVKLITGWRLSDRRNNSFKKRFTFKDAVGLSFNMFTRKVSDFSFAP